MIAEHSDRIACQIADLLDEWADDSSRATEAATDHGLALYEAGAAWALRIAAGQIRARVWPEPPQEGEDDHSDPE